MAYVHPRTGRSWATEAMAIQMDGPVGDTLAAQQAAGLVQTGLFAGNKTGTIEQIQTGSQWWMDSGYTGPEPSLEVKSLFSTADYARDWAGAYAKSLVAAGVDVSPAIGAIATDYPNPSKNTLDIWTAMPNASPIIAAINTVKNNGGDLSIFGIGSNTPSNSPGSTNEPSYVTNGGGAGTGAKTTTGTNAGSPNTTEKPDTLGGGGTSGLDALTSGLGGSALLIVGGIVAILFVFLMVTGHSGGSGVRA